MRLLPAPESVPPASVLPRASGRRTTRCRDPLSPTTPRGHHRRRRKGPHRVPWGRGGCGCFRDGMDDGRPYVHFHMRYVFYILLLHLLVFIHYISFLLWPWPVFRLLQITSVGMKNLPYLILNFFVNFMFDLKSLCKQKHASIFVILIHFCVLTTKHYYFQIIGLVYKFYSHRVFNT